MDQAPYQPPAQTGPDKAAAQTGKATARSAAKSVGKSAAMTPMMAQFFEIKAVNPGYLLFYRMGDFYELFFEDAEVAARALGIVLTRRGKHFGRDIPMCGVPIHAAQGYLKRLIALGHRVAICEQIEDPAEAKKRGPKTVVKRDVVRLVTPGTLTEDDLLPDGANNFLAALAMIRHAQTGFALAWADISTGEVAVTECAAPVLADELARIDPAELVLTQATAATLEELRLLPQGFAAHQAILDPELFESGRASDRIRKTFDDQVDPTAFSRAARAALGGLLAYVAQTQKQVPLALGTPLAESSGLHMALDKATRNSLELLVTNRGETKGALRHAIDLTVTPAGSRLLSRRLGAPLAAAGPINQRLDMVAACADDSGVTGRVRDRLKGVPDITRALTRIKLERGGPRDMAAIGKAIAAAIDLGETLGKLDTPPKGLGIIVTTLAAAPLALANKLAATLADDLPLLARDGGFVREGHDPDLDRERALAGQSRAVIARLQAELAQRTGIKSLKIRHNNVLGFFVEVPAAHGEKLTAEPHNAEFIHRQTMASAMRFSTTELAELQGRITHAQDAALIREHAIFDDLRIAITDQTGSLRATAEALAELDLTTALAHLAVTRDYCRPSVDGGFSFNIEAGRHPVVERTLNGKTGGFVANDCDLSGSGGEKAGQLWLVTGPNMGGKSTFLRQNALIAILAQMGSFVPAAKAHIGVLDRVFSRVGASDDIAHGHSTFMVEMVETAAILNRATARSLVILDEIGRGTATFDGLSIAWATAEALHETTRCRGLFATHFHEMTALAKTSARISNHTMTVREWRGEVVFLHQVAAGAADRSYGIQVARLAGLPEPVLERARAVLHTLEERGSGTRGAVLEDLPLFTHQPPPRPPLFNQALDMLGRINPDELTPRQAIDVLYALKKATDADNEK